MKNYKDYIISIGGKEVGVDLKEEKELYKIVQESVSNIDLKHSILTAKYEDGTETRKGLNPLLLKDIISSQISMLEALQEKVKGEQFADIAEAGQFAMHADGYNQALEELDTYLQDQITKCKELMK